ncbi:MAG TPA: sigma-54 dependent transcriptional regulator, partial [Candidatus Polarisedimenticolia bacterium]|nr:sigma-54 dependent transcriptional regulator [Candidatus Polarisedimenticolia bacterium]
LLDGASSPGAGRRPDGRTRVNDHGRSILIVEDDRAAAAYMTETLRESFEDLRTAGEATAALLAMETRPADLLILDLGLPDMSGLELMTLVRQRWTGVRVICVTATDDIPTVVEAVQRGASNYVVKPAAPAVLLAAAAKALAVPRASREAAATAIPEIVGITREMLHVRHLVVLAARSDVNVLITGETGTGKELIARAIHRLSGHAADSFLAYNCATTPPELFDSEFFGHQRGAFTGADRDHTGLLLRADGRTLLLDELETMRPQEQAKLLRVLDDGEVRPVGSNKVQRISVRFMAATNREPVDLIEQGLLREDLFYRLRGFAIHLPPLRRRIDDVAPLANHFLRDGARHLTPEALAALRQHHWPGNVRELRNVLRGARILAGDGPIDPGHLALPTSGQPRAARAHDAGPERIATLRETESQAILRALREARGHRGHAAQSLGIDRSTLRRKIRDLLAPHGAQPQEPGA